MPKVYGEEKMLFAPKVKHLEKILLSLSLVLISAYSCRGYSQFKPATAQEEIILYSIPGYDNATYDAGTKTFEQLYKMGRQYSYREIRNHIPRKVGMVDKNSELTILGFTELNVGGKKEKYAKVKYVNPDGTVVEGFTSAKLLSTDSPTDSQTDSPTDSQTAAGPGCVNCHWENLCKQNNTSVFCQANLLQSLVEAAEKDVEKVVEKDENKLKSNAELEKYFGCYKKSPPLQSLYIKEYQHHVAAAADAFAIPKPLLACLLFQESQWDAGIVNENSGATGIGQFLQPALDTLSIMLTDQLPKNATKIKKHKDAMSKFNNWLLEHIAAGAPGDVSKRLTNQNKKDQNFHATKVKQYELAVHWRDYVRLIKNNPKTKKDAVAVDLNRRGSINLQKSTDAKKPAIAIGLSAMYVRYIMDEMTRNNPSGQISSAKQNLHLMAAVAGAYNMGPGAAAKLIGTPTPTDTTAWVKKLSANKESNKHMLNIMRCMAKDDLSPPFVYDRKNNLKEQPKCK